MTDDQLDTPIWGAEAIARAAGLRKPNGEPAKRRAFYMLEQGLLDGDKIGERWVTTPRRIRRQFAGADAA